MDKDKQNRISRFINDRGMSETIYQFLLDTFTEPVKYEAQSSVEDKAANWISIQKLNKAWKDLENYKQEEETQSSVGTQVGL